MRANTLRKTAAGSLFVIALGVVIFKSTIEFRTKVGTTRGTIQVPAKSPSKAAAMVIDAPRPRASERHSSTSTRAPLTIRGNLSEDERAKIAVILQDYEDALNEVALTQNVSLAEAQAQKTLMSERMLIEIREAVGPKALAEYEKYNSATALELYKHEWVPGIQAETYEGLYASSKQFEQDLLWQPTAQGRGLSNVGFIERTLKLVTAEQTLSLLDGAGSEVTLLKRSFPDPGMSADDEVGLLLIKYRLMAGQLSTDEALGEGMKLIGNGQPVSSVLKWLNAKPSIEIK